MNCAGRRTNSSISCISLRKLAVTRVNESTTRKRRKEGVLCRRQFRPRIDRRSSLRSFSVYRLRRLCPGAIGSMVRAAAAMRLPYEPDPECGFCPRLAGFRNALRTAQPGWHNAPVPFFGAIDARLLVVGLAPGLNGANRTGRPFTGDFAGDLLYRTLIEYGFAAGTYDARPDDGLRLVSSAITNAVRCVPPQNKPESSEINNCRLFLTQTIMAMPNLQAIVALGRIAHESVVRAYGLRLALLPFAHGSQYVLGNESGGKTCPCQDKAGVAFRQLSLFQIQYEYGRADERYVPGSFRQGSGKVGRLIISQSNVGRFSILEPAT